MAARHKYSNYKKRREQLITAGFSAKETAQALKQEYGIYFTEAEIQRHFPKNPKTNHLPENNPTTQQPPKEVNNIIQNQAFLVLFMRTMKTLNFQLAIQNKHLQKLAYSAVRDNRISENEEVFLAAKSLEYNYPGNILADVKKALDYNNPYLDDLIHDIHADGKIDDHEIENLMASAKEIGLSLKFLSHRFWVITLSQYPHTLKDSKAFNDIMAAIVTYHNQTGDLPQPESIVKTLGCIGQHPIEQCIRMAADEQIKTLTTKLRWTPAQFTSSKNKISFTADFWETGVKNDITIPNQVLKFIEEQIRQQSSLIGDPASDLLAENLIAILHDNS